MRSSGLRNTLTIEMKREYFPSDTIDLTPYYIDEVIREANRMLNRLYSKKIMGREEWRRCKGLLKANDPESIDLTVEIINAKHEPIN